METCSKSELSYFCVHQKWFTDVELKINSTTQDCMRTTNFYKKNIPWTTGISYLTTFGRLRIYWALNWSTDGLALPDVRHKNSLTVLSVGKLSPD